MRNILLTFLLKRERAMAMAQSSTRENRATARRSRLLPPTMDEKRMKKVNRKRDIG